MSGAGALEADLSAMLSSALLLMPLLLLDTIAYVGRKSSASARGALLGRLAGAGGACKPGVCIVILCSWQQSTDSLT